MKLVFLDVKTIGDDLDLSPFDQFGEVAVSYTHLDVYKRQNYGR